MGHLIFHNVFNFHRNYILIYSPLNLFLYFAAFHQIFRRVLPLSTKFAYTSAYFQPFLRRVFKKPRFNEQRGKSGIKMLPLCRNHPRRMVAPDIETSTREERLEFIREEFKCLGNCPICGKCSFLRGREAEDLYADYIEGHRSFRDITAEHRNSGHPFRT